MVSTVSNIKWFECEFYFQELRLAVKLVQKEAAQSTNQKQEEFQLEIGDTECTRELIVSLKRFRFYEDQILNNYYFQALIEACFIHGINKKFSKISKKNGKEIHQINIWPIIEAITSQADQKSLKLENKLLQTKTGLARAAIRTFLNNQVNKLSNSF